jgi:transposase InsO family protein
VCDCDDQAPRFLIHDRDSIYGTCLRCRVKGFGTRCLATPPRAPQANSYCERVIRTLRRECLDSAAYAELSISRASQRSVPTIPNVLNRSCLADLSVDVPERLPGVSADGSELYIALPGRHTRETHSLHPSALGFEEQPVAIIEENMESTKSHLQNQADSRQIATLGL